MRIELNQVGKRFGRVVALDGIDLTIEAGTRLALIGPNGSGKSTLTRALMGLIACSGEVRLDGLSALRDRAVLARRLAYVPQVAPRVKASVGELVRAVTRLRGIDPGAVAFVAGELGLRLADVESRAFSALSGGMKQKVLIALALAGETSLLVLDEPTASLDPAARDRFFRLVDELAPGATVILCSHRLEEIRHLVNYVVVLEEGRVAFCGPSAEYLAKTARSLVEVQLRNGKFGDWLAERGFQKRAGGWWASTVRQDEKMALLGVMADSLGHNATNLLVRDLERLGMEVEELGELDAEDDDE